MNPGGGSFEPPCSWAPAFAGMTGGASDLYSIGPRPSSSPEGSEVSEVSASLGEEISSPAKPKKRSRRAASLARYSASSSSSSASIDRLLLRAEGALVVVLAELALLLAVEARRRREARPPDALVVLPDLVAGEFGPGFRPPPGTAGSGGSRPCSSASIWASQWSQMARLPRRGSSRCSVLPSR